MRALLAALAFTACSRQEIALEARIFAAAIPRNKFHSPFHQRSSSLFYTIMLHRGYFPGVQLRLRLRHGGIYHGNRFPYPGCVRGKLSLSTLMLDMLLLEVPTEYPHFVGAFLHGIPHRSTTCR